MTMNPDCHFGDHDFQRNGWCKWCDQFSGSLLQWGRFEKAEREGRAHFGHFHLTLETKQRCKRKPDPDWIESYGDSEVTLD